MPGPQQGLSVCCYGGLLSAGAGGEAGLEIEPVHGGAHLSHCVCLAAWLLLNTLATISALVWGVADFSP